MGFSEFGKRVDEEVGKSTPVVKYIVLGLIVLLFMSIGFCSLRGCSSNQVVSQQPVIMPNDAIQQPQQVIVERDDDDDDHHHHGSGVGTGAILGGAAGYMMGKNSASNKRPIIVNKTYVNKSYVRPYSYKPSSYRKSSRRR